LPKMRLLFLCRAGTEIGFGHLIRSRTLAETASTLHTVQMIVIGNDSVKSLLKNQPYSLQIVNTEDEVLKYVSGGYCAAIFDTMELTRGTVEAIQRISEICVSICPVFNQMEQMHLLFNRTKYILSEYLGLRLKKYLGIQYTLVQKACTKIPSDLFERNLEADRLNIAVSMGGGDAPNRTLRYLSHLRNCKTPFTFWIMLGEGYSHSFDDLVGALERDSVHEIVLAKTNASMWHILRNCSLAILPGGVTLYEAAYAGLPTATMFDSEDQQFLARELVEAGVSQSFGIVNEDGFAKMNDFLTRLNSSRSILKGMHSNALTLIDGMGGNRILQKIEEELSSR